MPVFSRVVKLSMIITITATLTSISATHAQSKRSEPFILGADISWIQQQENNGIRYYHNGQIVDPFEVLRDHGFNYIRLRLFVDPTATIPDESESPYSSTNQPGRQADASRPYCGLDSTVKMAKRAKAAGMKFLLDFHYSDTWADPEKQHKPMSWQHLTTMPQLTAKVREYTRETLERFEDEGVLPDMVQIGNETVGGMIWPEGKNWGGVPGSWPNFAALVNAGIDGVKDVSDDIQIMVHTINEQNPNWWLSTLISNGVTRIDVFGLSYYTEYHGQPDSLARVAAAFASNSNFSNLGIKFCVVEYAFNHRIVNDIVFDMPDNKGLGTFVWEPFDWRDVLFDWRSNPSGRHSNERLQWYPEMSKDYGNDDWADSSDIPTSVRNDRANANGNINFRINHNGVINYASTAPATVKIYTLRGRMVGSFDIKSMGTYDPTRILPIKLKSGAYIVSVKPENAPQKSAGIRVLK